MRFVVHGSGATRSLQIDWDVPVELGAELRAALAGHDVDRMHAGVLRRGYLFGAVLYPRGTIALRVADGHEIFLQVPADADSRPAAVPARTVTWATVAHDDIFDRYRIVVGDGDADERVDLIVARAVPALSRAVIQRLIDGGHVTISGGPLAKANRRVRRGDVIELVVARVEGD